MVSTVGNYYLPSKIGDGTPQEIGFHRFYETMAFHAMWEAPYWEANVTREVHFDSPWAIDRCDRETDIRADAMHEAVVDELCRKMERGEVEP